MFVKVGGKQIEVGVSDTGMFFDKATKQFSARTLRGLQEKIKKANTPKGEVSVENKEGKAGVVINKAGGRRYSRMYRVKWNDGTLTDEYEWSLRRPITGEDKKKLDELIEAESNARVVLQSAEEARRELEGNFSVSETLQAVFQG